MKNLLNVLTCGFCYNISRMDIISTISDRHVDIEPETGAGDEYGTDYNVCKCPKCGKANVICYHWYGDMEEEEIEYEILHPITKNAPIGLPPEIMKTYEAAEKVKTIEVNAYAILMRRLLEMVCLDRKAKSGTLASMLNDLAKKNEIPTKLVSVAKGLKDFGNLGAHAGSGQLTEREIPIVDALTRAVLEYIYSAPYLATLAEKKLKNIKSK